MRLPIQDPLYVKCAPCLLLAVYLRRSLAPTTAAFGDSSCGSAGATLGKILAWASAHAPDGMNRLALKQCLALA